MTNRSELSAAQERIGQILIDLAQGNPGALMALIEMMRDDFALSAPANAILKKYDIKGPMIWLVYKDLYHQDAAKMMDALMVDHGKTVAHQLQDLHYSGYTIPVGRGLDE